jgi:hypothetical protein
VLSRVPARSAPLWTRPLGYGVMTVVWLLLFVVATGATVGALPLSMSSTLHGRPLLEAPLFQRSDWVGSVIVILLVVAPLLGVIMLLVTCATLGVLLSAATLFARSFSPRYSTEKLSMSVWGRGDTIGPAFGVTMSLVPIRMTRWSKVVTIIRFNGFIPSRNLFVLGIVGGYGYLGTITWMLWPASGGAVPLCAAGTVVAAALFVMLTWRRRHRIANVMPDDWQATPYARSWPNRSVPPKRRRTRSTRR